MRIFTDDGACVASAGVMRRALEYARSLPGAVIAQHAEDPALAAGGHMHEGEWSSRLGIPGRPAEAESVIVARDLALAELTDGRVHFLHLSTAAAVELVREAKARGLAVTAEAAPHHFTLTDAACASFDPVFKVHPPLRSDADVAAVKRGPRRRHDRRHRHRPRPPHARGEGAAVRGGAPGHARPRDRARAHAHRAGRARRASPCPRRSRCCPGAPRRSPGSRDHGGPVEAGRPANLCVIDPGGDVGGRRRPPREPVAQHALRRAQAHRPRPPHGAARRAGRRRRESRSDERRPTRSWCSTTAPCSKARRSATFPRPAPPTGEVVFNTALSGYQEILTDPSYAGQIITFTYPHIGNYGVNDDDSESRRPFCRGVVVRDLARRASNWRATGDLDDFLRRHGVPGITGIDTRRLTRHLRDARRAAGRVRHRRERGARRRRAPRRGTDGLDLVAEVTTDAPYQAGLPDAEWHVVAYDFGIKRTILRHLEGAGCFVEVVPAVDARGRRARPRARRRVPLERPRRPRGAWPAPATRCAALLGEVPVFGICLGHQILGLALGRGQAQAPLRSPRRQPPGAPRGQRPGRDHEPEPQLRGRPRPACSRRRAAPT